MRARCCPFSISFLIYGRRGTLEICSTPIVCLLSLLRQQHSNTIVEHLLKSAKAVNVILTENPQADKQVNCQQLCFFFFCGLFSWHLCLLLYRKVILGEKYLSYEDALLKTGLKTLKQRREEKCLSFSLKCLKHPQLKRLFPLNENPHSLRNKDEFKINFAHTEHYRKTAIPYCQQMLNNYRKQGENV